MKWLPLFVLTFLIFPIEPAEAQVPGLQFNGEVGFRSEMFMNERFYETPLDDFRLRWRSRAKLGATYQGSQYWKTGLRLTTGPKDAATTSWATFNNMQRLGVSFDRAYVYGFLGPGSLRAGIEENPIFHPTTLIWDSDVPTSGLAQELKLRNITFRAGQFMLREFRDTEPENEEGSFLYVGQLDYFWELKYLDVRWAMGYYHYQNPDVLVRSIQDGSLTDEYKSNRFDGDKYLSNFEIAFCGLKIDLKPSPISLRSEISNNLGASNKSFGFGGLLYYGKLEDRWTWKVGSGFYYIESDAVLAAFNSNDAQQTNIGSVPVSVSLRFPGDVDLTWDTYFQRRLDLDLPGPMGLNHMEDAIRIRTRLSLIAKF